jgi:FMN phosphatase YigB (HAD superfamily)
MTPSSAAALTPHRGHALSLTPVTPNPKRAELNHITGDVAAIIFDFDGTLTQTPGDAGTQRWQKKAELCARAALLAPRLKELVSGGYSLGIMSKSTEGTIQNALEEADLAKYFDLPLVGKAVGLEGKMGFIKEMVSSGALSHLGLENIGQVLLIDDDIYELDRARREGIQTWTSPVEGGLQEADFDEIFTWLNQPAFSYGNPPKTPGSTRNRSLANTNTPCNRRTPRHSRVQTSGYPA